MADDLSMADDESVVLEISHDGTFDVPASASVVAPSLEEKQAILLEHEEEQQPSLEEKEGILLDMTTAEGDEEEVPEEAQREQKDEDAEGEFHDTHEDFQEAVEDASEDDFEDAHESEEDFTKDAQKAEQMKEQGNSLYKDREWQDAAEMYTLAIEYCPLRSSHQENMAVYYCNRAACYVQLEEWDYVVEDCSKALELKPQYVKALMRRAQANEKLEKYDVAGEDVKAVLEVDPSCAAAKQSLPRLDRLQREKMERMKEEAMSKLKEMGNSILGHFGMSLDNFKVQQDETSGSYNIAFEQGNK